MFGEGIIFKITHFQKRMKRMTSFTACFNEKEPFAVMQKENNVRYSENSLQSCSLSAAERQHFPSSGRLVGSSICFCLETTSRRIFGDSWELFVYILVEIILFCSLSIWWLMWPWRRRILFFKVWRLLGIIWLYCGGHLITDCFVSYYAKLWMIDDTNPVYIRGF